MSFLLRRSNNRNRPPPPAPARAGMRNAFPKAPSGRLGAPSAGGGGQVQQLLQRQRPAPQQGGILRQNLRQSQQKSQMQHTQEQQQQMTNQQSAQQQQNAAKVQGVISMEEVMEDLRVLEQQQRDSQRKLETIKLTKQHKLEQRTSLENKLASVNYSNGEKRAQLHRCREVLGQCTRELGTSKLWTGKSGEGLKSFDNKLKRGLSLARSHQILRRKLDVKLAAARKAEAQLAQLHTKAREKVKAGEMKLDEDKHGEQRLRKSIQSHHVNAKQLAEETTRLRAESASLDKDLATAHELESSTKLRVESIASDIAADDKRHDEVIQESKAKMEECEKEKVARDAKDKALQAEMVEKKKDLHEEWLLCIKIQAEEGHEKGIEPTEGETPPFLDVSRLRHELASEERGFLEESKAREKTQASIEENQREILLHEAKELTASQQTKCLLGSSRELAKVEDERRHANKDFWEKLEKVRSEVEELRRSKVDLEASLTETNAKASDELSHKHEALQTDKAALAEAKEQLTVQTKQVTEAREIMKQQQIANADEVNGAKKRAEETKDKFEQTRGEVEEFLNVMDTETEKQVEDFRRAQALLIEDTEAEIANLLEDCPALATVEVIYDPSKSIDEHTLVALSELRDECESRVETAQNNREVRLKVFLREREAQKQAKREALLKAKRRAEEEAKEAERLREEKAAEVEAKRLRRKQEAALEAERLRKEQEAERRRNVEEAALEAERLRREEEAVLQAERLREEEEATLVAEKRKWARKLERQKQRKREEEAAQEAERKEEARRAKRVERQKQKTRREEKKAIALTEEEEDLLERQKRQDVGKNSRMHSLQKGSGKVRDGTLETAGPREAKAVMRRDEEKGGRYSKAKDAGPKRRMRVSNDLSTKAVAEKGDMGDSKLRRQKESMRRAARGPDDLNRETSRSRSKDGRTVAKESLNLMQALDGRHQYGKTTGKRRTQPRERNTHPVMEESLESEPETKVAAMTQGSQRRVRWGDDGIADGALTQTCITDDDAWNSEISHSDRILTQKTSYSEQILTQLSQEDRRSVSEQSSHRLSILQPSAKTSAKEENKHKRHGDSSSRRSRNEKKPARRPSPDQDNVLSDSNGIPKRDAKRVKTSSLRREKSILDSSTDISAKGYKRENSSASLEVSEKGRKRERSSAATESSSDKAALRYSNNKSVEQKDKQKAHRVQSTKRRKEAATSRESSSQSRKRTDPKSSRQTSGISSMERAAHGKSRRRKKKDGAPTKKSKAMSLGAMSDDYNFNF